MAKINRSVCVAHTPKQMYDLVNDVASYPTFLPLCSGTKVHEKNAHRQKATITISKGKIGFSFTTDNSMEENKTIVMNLVDGPFKYFRGAWRFKPAGDYGCQVSIHVEFEFANRILSAALGGLFCQLIESFAEAFCNQAAVRYGD
ncbi:MAG: type II toxin-antitoxin system RatA family toxin [Pseudomonadota bacterium]